MVCLGMAADPPPVRVGAVPAGRGHRCTHSRGRRAACVALPLGFLSLTTPVGCDSPGPWYCFHLMPLVAAWPLDAPWVWEARPRWTWIRPPNQGIKFQEAGKSIMVF